jgi:hypothetical protein
MRISLYFGKFSVFVSDIFNKNTLISIVKWAYRKTTDTRACFAFISGAIASSLSLLFVESVAGKSDTYTNQYKELFTQRDLDLEQCSGRWLTLWRKYRLS